MKDKITKKIEKDFKDLSNCPTTIEEAMAKIDFNANENEYRAYRLAKLRTRQRIKGFLKRWIILLIISIVVTVVATILIFKEPEWDSNKRKLNENEIDFINKNAYSHIKDAIFEITINENMVLLCYQGCVVKEGAKIYFYKVISNKDKFALTININGNLIEVNQDNYFDILYNFDTIGVDDGKLDLYITNESKTIYYSYEFIN